MSAPLSSVGVSSVRWTVDRSAARGTKSSMSAMTARLKTLLPNIPPAARSTESATATADAPVASSGSDVAVASSRIPTKARLIPVRSASASPERASH